MKNSKNDLCSSFLPACFLAIVLLFFTTCFSPLDYGSDDEDEWNDGVTRLVITLPGGNSNSRNLTGNSIMGYDLLFEGPGGKSFTEKATGGDTVRVEVVPGLWSVKVRLYSPSTNTIDEAKGEVLNFNVKEGVPNKPLIQMRFVRISPMIINYLSTVTGSGPASLHLDLPLDSAAWSGLLNEIQAGGKNVDLNLSECAMTGTVFEPDHSISTGKDKIKGLVLPNAATSIGSCGNSDPIALYLAALPGGATPSDPVGLKVQMQLTASAWEWLLDEILDSGKYVDLDLADCTRSGSATGTGLRSDGNFIHEASYDMVSGKHKIITLVLPNAASSIEMIPGFDPSTGISWLSTAFMVLKSFSGTGLTSIGNRAFYSCEHLEMTALPASILSIGGSAFFGCRSITITSLPAALTSIGTYAFANCTNITSMNLSPSAPIVGNPFPGCSSITFTVAGAGLLSAAEGGRALVRNGDEMVAYPSAPVNIDLGYIRTVGVSAFAFCTNLETASFPDATHIDGQAFYACTSLRSVAAPIATVINTQAFYQCTSLENVNFPSVTKFGLDVFQDTSGQALTVTLGATPPAVLTGIFEDVVTSKTVTVKFPSSATGYGTVPTNTTSENWGNAFRGMGWDGVTTYGDAANVNGNIILIYETYL